MYKYFMGKISNLKTRALDTPIVIAVDNNASKLINSWIDYYSVDFDVFIDGVKQVFEVDIEKIRLESKGTLLIRLEDGRAAFIELLREKEPKCVIHIEKNKYTFNYKTFEIEKFYEEIDDLICSFDKSKCPIEFYARIDEYVICIKYFDIIAEVYEKLKKNIFELENWDNIIEVISWINSLDLGVFTYSITVYDLEQSNDYLMKLDVNENKVMKFTTLDEHDEVYVESNGDWAIKHEDVLIKYDDANKKRCFFIPKDKAQNVDAMNQLLKRALELTTSMFRVTEILDDILQGFSN